MRAIHVFTDDGRLLRAGGAALYLLEHTGWPRSARLLSLPPFSWCVELGYRLVARNRRHAARWFMRDSALDRLAEEQRAEACALRAQVVAAWGPRRA